MQNVSEMQKTGVKTFILLTFIVIIGIGLLFSCKISKKSLRISEPVIGTYEILEKIPVERIWPGTQVGYSLLTHENHQFIAYYDENRQMTVAQRLLDSKDWTFKKLDSFIGWDSHNYITMALDKEGYLHVSGNMHGVPLIYFRTSLPYDVTTLEQELSMIGKNEKRVTYPKFFLGPKDELIFTYRDGGSGNGKNFYNLFHCCPVKPVI